MAVTSRATARAVIAPQRTATKVASHSSWTERKTQAALALFADEVATDEERKQFEESVRDVACNTPSAQVGANRILRLLKKIGGGTAKAIRDILVDVASETAKKTLFPDPK